MPSLNLLRKRGDFVLVTRKGTRIVTRGLILEALPIPDKTGYEKGMQVGFTASSRIGNAVKRNRVKRILREMARQVLPLKGKDSYYYVLVGRKETLERSFDKLIHDLEYALKRVHG